MTSRRLRRLLAIAFGSLALAALGAPAAGAADEAAWLYDPDAIVEIDLGGLSPAEIDLLEAEPDEYQRGTFELRVGGVAQGPALDVGIRLKGGMGSFRPLTEKAGFKVKFDEYVKKQKFFGLEKLTLNNMVQDPSMVHETLTYELFRSLGLPASRTGYAFVRVNSAVYGLYLNIETLDEISLPSWFASTGHLYEADTPGVDVKPGGAEDFEVDEGDDEDITDLEALIAAANDTVGDWSDGMAGIADLTQMTRTWAIERYVGHWDGYAGEADAFRPNNYYLHSDETGLFSMLPWGTDQTWERSLDFDEPAGGLLFNNCLDDASCAALYVEALEDVQSAVATLGLGSHAAELTEMLAPCQALELEPRREYTAAEIEQGVEDTRELIAERPAELADWLGVENPPVEDPPGTLPAGSCSPADDDPPGEDPSLESPGPEGEQAPPGGSSAPQAGGSQASASSGAPRINNVRFRDTLVIASVDVPGAGAVKKRVTVRGKRGWGTVCTDQASPSEAGRLTLRCRLPEGVRRQLKAGPLRLRIWVDFTPVAGQPSSISRRLTAPKLTDRR